MILPPPPRLSGEHISLAQIERGLIDQLKQFKRRPQWQRILRFLAGLAE